MWTVRRRWKSPATPANCGHFRGRKPFGGGFSATRRCPASLAISASSESTAGEGSSCCEILAATEVRQWFASTIQMEDARATPLTFNGEESAEVAGRLGHRLVLAAGQGQGGSRWAGQSRPA